MSACALSAAASTLQPSDRKCAAYGRRKLRIVCATVATMSSRPRLRGEPSRSRRGPAPRSFTTQPAGAALAGNYTEPATELKNADG